MCEYTEVMYNNCYGGFNLSNEAKSRYIQLKKLRGEDCVCVFDDDIERTDPLMIQIVKEMGHKASGHCASIEIKSIPSIYKDHYIIGEYDGSEWVHIDLNAFKLDKIKKIVQGSEENKLELINDVISDI